MEITKATDYYTSQNDLERATLTEESTDEDDALQTDSGDSDSNVEETKYPPTYLPHQRHASSVGTPNIPTMSFSAQNNQQNCHTGITARANSQQSRYISASSVTRDNESFTSLDQVPSAEYSSHNSKARPGSVKVLPPRNTQQLARQRDKITSKKNEKVKGEPVKRNLDTDLEALIKDFVKAEFEEMKPEKTKLYDIVILYDKRDYEEVRGFQTRLIQISRMYVKEELQIDLYDSEVFVQSKVRVIQDVTEKCSTILVYLTANLTSPEVRFFIEEAIAKQNFPTESGPPFLIRPVQTMRTEERNYTTPPGLVSATSIDWFDSQSAFTLDKIIAVLKDAIKRRKRLQREVGTRDDFKFAYESSVTSNKHRNRVPAVYERDRSSQYVDRQHRQHHPQVQPAFHQHFRTPAPPSNNASRFPFVQTGNLENLQHTGMPSMGYPSQVPVASVNLNQNLPQNFPYDQRLAEFSQPRDIPTQNRMPLPWGAQLPPSENANLLQHNPPQMYPQAQAVNHQYAHLPLNPSINGGFPNPTPKPFLENQRNQTTLAPSQHLSGQVNSSHYPEHRLDIQFPETLRQSYRREVSQDGLDSFASYSPSITSLSSGRKVTQPDPMSDLNSDDVEVDSLSMSNDLSDPEIDVVSSHIDTNPQKTRKQCQNRDHLADRVPETDSDVDLESEDDDSDDDVLGGIMKGHKVVNIIGSEIVQIGTSNSVQKKSKKTSTSNKGTSKVVNSSDEDEEKPKVHYRHHMTNSSLPDAKRRNKNVSSKRRSLDIRMKDDVIQKKTGNCAVIDKLKQSETDSDDSDDTCDEMERSTSQTVNEFVGDIKGGAAKYANDLDCADSGDQNNNSKGVGNMTDSNLNIPVHDVYTEVSSENNTHGRKTNGSVYKCSKVNRDVERLSHFDCANHSNKVSSSGRNEPDIDDNDMTTVNSGISVHSKEATSHTESVKSEAVQTEARKQTSGKQSPFMFSKALTKPPALIFRNDLNFDHNTRNVAGGSTYDDEID